MVGRVLTLTSYSFYVTRFRINFTQYYDDNQIQYYTVALHKKVIFVLHSESDENNLDPLVLTIVVYIKNLNTSSR